jgi:hypothetical protein
VNEQMRYSPNSFHFAATHHNLHISNLEITAKKKIKIKKNKQEKPKTV